MIQKKLERKIIDYFLLFANPSPHDTPEYWARDYFTFGQLILGIIFFPICLIFWILKKIFLIKL